MRRLLSISCIALVALSAGAAYGLSLTAAQIAALTVSGTVPPNYVVGTYVSGGNGTTGTAPANAWSFTIDGSFDPSAGNAVDYHWMQASSSPLIYDLGAVANDVLLFPTIDHGPMDPAPYEALESTVWGSNNPNAPFPAGWVQGTLTRIYADGWVDASAAQESDDFASLWNFGTSSFRYVAVHADRSVEITPENGDNNDCFGSGHWCSAENEIDAVARVTCGASLIQDGCTHFTDGGKNFTRINFSVVNRDLATPVCDVHIIPESEDPDCRFVSCSHPLGWSCNVRPDGGADWVADTAADCIPPHSIKHGFDFLLDPAFCCYIVQFTGPNGEIICSQEECFSCQQVGVKPDSWSNIKKLYR